MRWVNRGPKPAGVDWYRRQFTQGWVDYSQNPDLGQPNDSYWRRFAPELRGRFDGKCGYCERRCAERSEVGSRAPTVDHFRPKSRFPRLTYEWSNWIFCCSRCNGRKADKWPATGLVDPCAIAILERPERYFDYNHRTGEIMPRAGLVQDDRDKAFQTVADLGLNVSEMRRNRRRWIDRLITLLTTTPHSELVLVVSGYTNVAEEYCGITRMFLAQYQRPDR